MLAISGNSLFLGNLLTTITCVSHVVFIFNWGDLKWFWRFNLVQFLYWAFFVLESVFVPNFCKHHLLCFMVFGLDDESEWFWCLLKMVTLFVIFPCWLSKVDQIQELLQGFTELSLQRSESEHPLSWTLNLCCTLACCPPWTVTELRKITNPHIYQYMTACADMLLSYVCIIYRNVPFSTKPADYLSWCCDSTLGWPINISWWD